MRTLVLLSLLGLTGLAGCGAACPVEPAGAARWDTAAPRVAAMPSKPTGATRLIVGGDSRKAFVTEGKDAIPHDLATCDAHAPLSRSFAAAAPSGASAYLFLGDMEHTPMSDEYFSAVLGHCLDKAIPFCPVFGNHEAKVQGFMTMVHPETAREDFARRELPRCAAAMPEEAKAAGRVFYAVDLPNKIHFVALDNVSDKGFGAAQLRWLARDLEKAHAGGAAILVGMHKVLAGNGVTGHGMDEDGAIADSAAALALFEANHVALVLASHEHGYWELRLGGQAAAGTGLHGFITGGLGAPLKTCAGPRHAFFHYLVVDVLEGRADVHVIDVPNVGHAGDVGASADGD